MSKTELMDIGEHCSFCGQIDFLPFKCSCKQTFCMLHRIPESHQCVNLKQSTHTIPSPKQTHQFRDGTPNSFPDMPSSQSLFPDRSKPVEIKFKTTETNHVRIKDASRKSTSALDKLMKFFRENGKSKLKQSSTTNYATKKIIALSKLKSSARGDSRIPVSERVFINVQILNDKADTSLKHPVYVSRAWPVGRALDSIADILKVKNVNNRTTDQNEKLFLFKLKEILRNGEPDLMKIETGDRVIKTLSDGDDIYLVRGTDV